MPATDKQRAWSEGRGIKNVPTFRIDLRLDLELATRFIASCERRGISRADGMKQLIKDYLDKEERNGK